MSDNLIIIILITFAAYFIGAIPWAFIIGKCKGIDIREYGSGNVGATNVRRTLGKKFGILCFILDFLKGFLPVLVINLLIAFKKVDLNDIVVVTVAIAAVFGHIWPVYLKFRGGKGVSTIAGILLAVAPLSLVASGLLWGIIFYSSRYVSLASIVSAVIFPLSAYIFSKTGVYSLTLNLQLMLIVMSALVVIRHYANIKRLLSGTENRFGSNIKNQLTASKPKDN